MTGHLTIALDAMGGDNAPQSVLNGANLARKRFPQVRFVLVGDEARLAPMLDRLPRPKKINNVKASSVSTYPSICQYKSFPLNQHFGLLLVQIALFFPILLLYIT